MHDNQNNVCVHDAQGIQLKLEYSSANLSMPVATSGQIKHADVKGTTG